MYIICIMATTSVIKIYIRNINIYIIINDKDNTDGGGDVTSVK